MGAGVIVMTICPTDENPLHRRLVCLDEIDEGIEDVNHYIRDSTQNSVIVLDVAKILSGTKG